MLLVPKPMKESTMTRYNVAAIDTVMNYEFDDFERTGWAANFIRNKIGAEEDRIKAVTVDYMLEKMDRAGVEHAFLIAVKAGSAMTTINRRIPYEVVAELCRKYPKRFSGLAGVDPTEGMAGLRELERGIKEYG